MSDDAPVPLDPNFRIQLPSFEGPLDLLLHLIRKHELDVLDLPIDFITARYLEYIGLMERLNLDIAGEYLVMAATLAHIKSKSLLPVVPVDEDDPDEEQGDPREQLIRRLLEYQKYKRAAEDLGARSVAGRDVFLRGAPNAEVDEEAPLASTSVFRLLDAFSAVMRRHQGTLAFEITAERITIQERIAQILGRLEERRSIQFDELFTDLKVVYDVVVTFLAILEMAKSRIVRVYQAGPDEPLHIQARLLAAEDPPASLESDALGADAGGATTGSGPSAETMSSETTEPKSAWPLDSEQGVGQEGHPSNEEPTDGRAR